LNLWARREGARILLVDDDERIRDSLRLFFEDQGCIFMAVGRAEHALEELERHPFDIIILDYKLPGMNGLELLGKIRKTHPATAKIFITAYSGEDLFGQARKAGAVGFVRKPLTSEKIEECLARIDHRDRIPEHRKGDVPE
jgi:two-component system nitrogen regulation response regulator NtrX